MRVEDLLGQFVDRIVLGTMGSVDLVDAGGAVHGLCEPVPVRRRRSRASFSESEVMGCRTVC
jgi:hypothetical protein